MYLAKDEANDVIETRQKRASNNHDCSEHPAGLLSAHASHKNATAKQDHV